MRKMYPSNKHRIVELSAIIIIILSFAVGIYGVMTLPESVPVHFDLYGNPDKYGSPKTFFVVNIVMIIPMAIISLVSHFVDVESMNLTFKVNRKNRDKVKESVQMMMYILELEFALYRLFMSIKSVSLNMDGVFIAMAVLIVSMTLTIIWGIKDSKKKNEL